MRGAAFLSGCATRWSSTSAAPPPTWACSSRLPARVGRRGRHRRRPHELPHAGRRSRSRSAAARVVRDGRRRRRRSARTASATSSPSEALVFGGDDADPDRRRRGRRPGRGRRPATAAARRARCRGGLDGGRRPARRRGRPGQGRRGDGRWWSSAAASVLVPDAMPGVCEVLRPDHHDVANADRRGDRAGQRAMEEVVTLDGDRDAVDRGARERRATAQCRRAPTRRPRRDRRAGRGPAGLPRPSRSRGCGSRPSGRRRAKRRRMQHA